MKPLENASLPISASASAAPMRLLVQDLHDGDLARISAFLRGGSSPIGGRWQLVFDGEADLILIGGAEPITVRGMLDAPAAVVHVVDAQRSDLSGPMLSRPIDYNALMRLLDETARRRGLASAGPAGLPPAPMPASPVTPAGPDMSQPVAAKTPATPLPKGVRFRLRHWPPQALLEDEYARRLAAFMSQRPVNLAELSILSNVPAQRCREFAAELNAVGLLEFHPLTPAPRALEPVPLVPGPTPAHGVLGRFRRSLGLE